MGAWTGPGMICSVAEGASDAEREIPAPADIDFGNEDIRGFLFDNVLHSEEDGDIHFGLYIPESYDGSKPYALFVTLPGYEGLYFQGIGVNIQAEDYGIEAQKYNETMIIVAPQLNDWREPSARETVTLTRYFLEHYNIDPEKVYLNGYSGGGETGSLVMELAEAFVDVLADFIREIGLPTTFAEMNIPDDTDYKAIADSTVLTGGCAKKFTRKELLEVLLECR